MLRPIQVSVDELIAGRFRTLILEANPFDDEKLTSLFQSICLSDEMNDLRTHLVRLTTAKRTIDIKTMENTIKQLILDVQQNKRCLVDETNLSIMAARVTFLARISQECMYTNEVETAIKLLKHAIEIIKKIPNPNKFFLKDLIYLHSNLVFAYTTRNDKTSMLLHLLESAKTFFLITSKDSDEYLEEAKISNKLAEMCLETKNYQGTLLACNQALSAVKQVTAGDHILLVLSIYIKRAFAHENLQQHRLALKTFITALEEVSLSPNQTDECLALKARLNFFVSKLYFNFGDYDKALTHINESFKFHRNHRHFPDTKTALANLRVDERWKEEIIKARYEKSQQVKRAEKLAKKLIECHGLFSPVEAQRLYSRKNSDIPDTMDLDPESITSVPNSPNDRI